MPRFRITIVLWICARENSQGGVHGYECSRFSSAILARKLSHFATFSLHTQLPRSSIHIPRTEGHSLCGMITYPIIAAWKYEVFHRLLLIFISREIESSDHTCRENKRQKSACLSPQEHTKWVVTHWKAWQVRFWPYSKVSLIGKRIWIHQNCSENMQSKV